MLREELKIEDINGVELKEGDFFEMLEESRWGNYEIGDIFKVQGLYPFTSWTSDYHDTFEYCGDPNFHKRFKVVSAEYVDSLIAEYNETKDVDLEERLRHIY